MEVYISGQLGRAVVPQGGKALLFEIGDLPEAKPYSIEKTSILLEGARDIRQYSLNSHNDIIRQLNSEYKKDKSLLLLLMLLDASTSKGLQIEISELLEEYLSEKEILEFIQNKLFSHPIPDESSLVLIADTIREHTTLSSFMQSFEESQAAIKIVRNSWEKISPHYFEDKDTKSFLENSFVEMGFFYGASMALLSVDEGAMNKVKLSAWISNSLKDIKGYRDIVSAWLNPITPNKKLGGSKNFANLLAAAEEKDRKNKESRNKKEFYKKETSNHQAFLQATKQIDEIKSQLRKVRLSQAQKYTEELIYSQLDNNDAPYLAKSLCNIAKYAYDVHQKSFSLHLNERAVKIFPEDGFAWSALAENYILFGRYDEAAEALTKANLYGEELFADSASLRILKFKGEYEQAIEKYLAIIPKHSSSEEQWNLIEGLADAYVSIGEYEKATQKLIEGIEKFPMQPDLKCSLANLYFLLGKFSDAHKVFEDAAKLEAAPMEAFIGITHLYKEQDQYKEALETIIKAKALFPDGIELYSEEADIYKLMGMTSKALQLYAKMQEIFPYDYRGFTNSAVIYADLKKSERAKQEFFKARALEIEKDIGFEIRYARLLKSMGMYKDALQLYSELLNKNPHNLSLRLGQADLFKELGYYDEALKIYTSIPEGRVDRVKNISMAAIYTALGQYANALQLLPASRPQTKSDWVAYHVRGMALIKAGKMDEASQHFEGILEKIPFAQQRSYFKYAMALLHIKGREFAEAIEVLAVSETPISNVIKLHAYCGLNKLKEAKETYDKINDNNPDNIIYLRNEIGAHYRLNQNAHGHDGKWIYEQECNSVAVLSTISKAA